MTRGRAMDWSLLDIPGITGRGPRVVPRPDCLGDRFGRLPQCRPTSGFTLQVDSSAGAATYTTPCAVTLTKTPGVGFEASSGRTCWRARIGSAPATPTGRR